MSLAKSNTLMISIRNKPYRKTTCHLLKALVSKWSKLSHRVVLNFENQLSLFWLPSLVEIPDQHRRNSGCLPISLFAGRRCFGLETAITVLWAFLQGSSGMAPLYSIQERSEWLRGKVKMGHGQWWKGTKNYFRLVIKTEYRGAIQRYID